MNILNFGSKFAHAIIITSGGFFRFVIVLCTVNVSNPGFTRIENQIVRLPHLPVKRCVQGINVPLISTVKRPLIVRIHIHVFSLIVCANQQLILSQIYGLADIKLRIMAFSPTVKIRCFMRIFIICFFLGTVGQVSFPAILIIP